MTQPTASAAPALDRALTFALIEVAMVILMGARRATLTIPERASFGREARELLEHGVQLARDAVAVSVADGRDRAVAAAGHADAVQYCYAVLGPREQVIARGQLAELHYMAAQAAAPVWPTYGPCACGFMCTCPNS